MIKFWEHKPSIVMQKNPQSDNFIESEKKINDQCSGQAGQSRSRYKKKPWCWGAQQQTKWKLQPPPPHSTPWTLGNVAADFCPSQKPHASDYCPDLMETVLMKEILHWFLLKKKQKRCTAEHRRCRVNWLAGRVDKIISISIQLWSILEMLICFEFGVQSEKHVQWLDEVIVNWWRDGGPFFDT